MAGIKRRKIEDQPIGFSNGLHNTIGGAPRAPGRQPISPLPTLVRNPNHTFSSGAVQVNAVSSTVVSASASRRYLLIQNVGINQCHLGFGTLASNQTGIELNAGFEIAFEEGILPNNAIDAISAIGTTLVILEASEI